MAREEAADGKARNRRTGLVASILVRMRAVLRSGFAGFGGVRAERRMELIETLQLGGKRQLLLVSCDGQRYLVGAGGDSVHSIAGRCEDRSAVRRSAVRAHIHCHRR